MPTLSQSETAHGAVAASQNSNSPQFLGRLRQLDGLRGIAAFVVLIHHSMLLFPSFADTYFVLGHVPPVGSLMWWLTASPLKVFTAGGEAVTVFFVMSGIVLTLPVLAKNNFNWLAYYPRRVVRLWLPVFVSIFIAAALFLIAAKPPVVGFSRWVDLTDLNGVNAQRMISAMDVLYGGNSINSPLWSLRWEMVFSLALPIFLALALWMRKWPYVAILGVAAIVYPGYLWNNESLRFLAPFLVGVIIAVSFKVFERHAAKIGALRISHVVWALITLISLMLVVSYWLVRHHADSSIEFHSLTVALSTVGAAGLIVSAIFWRPLAWILTTRVVQWCGKISFSLYLVHIPIILATAHLLGPAHMKWVFLIVLVVAPAVAVIFTRFVEQPSHRLAKRAGESLSARVATFKSSTASH